jgi:transposase-like protein
MRNLLATVPHAAREPVAALVRTIFAQPDPATARAQLHKIADGLRPRCPQAAALLAEAAEHILAHRHFPSEHRARLHSTNPLEHLPKEIKRRSTVVGIFPHRGALLRLVGAILAEQDDEWAVADRRYFSAKSMKLLTQPLVMTSQEDLLTAIA